MTTTKLPRDDDWMRYGTDRPCQNDPDQWFSASHEAKRRAIAACGTCPLLQPCRAYALEHLPSHGVWGGLTETGRRKLRASVPGCETVSAFQRHRSKGEHCNRCESWRAEQIAAERRSRLVDEHLKGGTRSGARIHYRLGEPACRACAAAAYRARQTDPAGARIRSVREE